jgi:hypothetical protein
MQPAFGEGRRRPAILISDSPNGTGELSREALPSAERVQKRPQLEGLQRSARKH